MHNQRVRELISNEQLLEYNVKEGWERLCEFLEVDVPEAPFPKLNEGDSIKAVYAGHQIFGAFVWGIYLSLGFGVVYLAYDPWRAIGKSKILMSYLPGKIWPLSS